MSCWQRVDLFSLRHPLCSLTSLLQRCPWFQCFSEIPNTTPTQLPATRSNANYQKYEMWMYKSNNWIIQWVKWTSAFHLSDIQYAAAWVQIWSLFAAHPWITQSTVLLHGLHVLTTTLKPPNKCRCHLCLWCLAICVFALWVQGDAWEERAASRQELEQRPWLCWRLQGARLEIKPNKNVWFVAFIFGRCQLQFELARCLEAGWVTNMKDALMNCWQSSASSLIHYMMAMKTAARCFAEVWPRLMASIFHIS